MGTTWENSSSFTKSTHLQSEGYSTLNCHAVFTGDIFWILIEKMFFTPMLAFITSLCYYDRIGFVSTVLIECAQTFSVIYVDLTIMINN